MKVVSLQRGTTSLGAGSGSTTATIAAVVTNRSKVMINFQLNDASPKFGMITRELTNSTTLTFARDTATASPAVTIRWTVVEFDATVNIQRGSFTFNGSETTHPTTLSTIVLANSYASITSRNPGNIYGDDDFYSAALTTTTNLDVVATLAPAATAVVKWEVIECLDGTFTTQTGTISFASGDPSLTASPTSTAQSWLIYSWNGNTGTAANIGSKLMHGVITSSSLLTFSRNNTGNTMVLTWFLVTHTDTTTVQRGTEAFTTSETLRNITLSLIDLNRTLAIAGGIFSKGGKSNYAGDDNPGVGGWMDLDLSTSTNLAATRALTGTATAEIGWFVISFEGFFPPELFLSRRTNLRTL